MKTGSRILVAAALVSLSLPLVNTSALGALPSGATDATVVPHYFGPWPNWALSPLTLTTAAVSIDGAGKDAAAVAQVDPVTGGIASISVTSPGHDYVQGTTTVTIAGSTGTAATAAGTVESSTISSG